MSQEPEDVLIHTCNDRDTDPRNMGHFNLTRRYYTDDPLFKSFLPIPLKCKCKKRVNLLLAKIMIANGQALRVYKPTVGKADTLEDGHSKNISHLDRTQIVKVVNRAQTPRVDVVTKAHMERAYVSGNQFDIEHIEMIHEMLVKGLKALIVPFEPHPDDMFDDEYLPLPGRLLCPFGPDQRTAGGYVKN